MGITMEDLAEKRCLACEGGQPPLTDDQISRLMPGLGENWDCLLYTSPSPRD